MATLVAHASETAITQIPLRPGINTLGRAEGNHCVVPHTSISSRHCELVVSSEGVSVRDLGSTNGTFIDGQQVQDATIRHGQRLQLGDVEFVMDAPETVSVAKAGPLRVSVPRSAGRAPTPPTAGLAPALQPEPSFYREVPSAFAYPFKRNGLILLTIGAIVFMLLKFLSGFIAVGGGGVLSLIFTVITVGYLFAYMQKIIAHSAQGEDEMPDFPDFGDWWSDIIMPFLLFASTVAVSLLPAIIIFNLMDRNEMAALAFWPALGIGVFYLPMALLAVAVTDNFLALSPHLVVPSICRVFLPYLVTFLFLASLFSIRMAVEWSVHLVRVTPLPLTLAATVVMSFLSLYLLMVEMRTLGLFFRSYRSRLGWL